MSKSSAGPFIRLFYFLLSIYVHLNPLVVSLVPQTVIAFHSAMDGLSADLAIRQATIYLTYILNIELKHYCIKPNILWD